MTYVWHCVTRVSRVVWRGMQLNGCAYSNYVGVPCILPKEDDHVAYQRWLYDHRPES